jgi:parvulin-like peptidyl-prolyl isomerase
MLSLLVLSFCLVACSKNDAGKDEKAATADTDLVIAESENFTIYASEAFQFIKKGVKAGHGNPNAKDFVGKTDKVINSLSVMYLVYDDAKQKGFLKKDFVKIAEKYFAANTIRGVAEGKINEEAASRITEEYIEEALKRNLPEKNDKIIIRQIVSTTKEEAKNILKKVKAGEDFIELVEKYSTGPAASLRSGLSDPYFRGNSGIFSNPKEEEEVFALNEGEIYDGIVESPLGYIVCKVERKFSVSDEEIKKLKDTIVSGIYGNEARKVISEIYDKYKDVAIVEKVNLFEYLERSVRGEELGDPVVATFQGLNIRISTLNWGEPSSRPITSKDKTELQRVNGIFLSNIRKFLSELMLGDYYKDIEIPDIVQKAMRASIKEKVAIAYVNTKFGDVDLTEEEARQFFDDHPDQYYRSEKVDVSVIMTATEEDGIMVMQKYNEGEPYPELAKKYSIDEATAAKGGGFGLITLKNPTVPEKFMNIIFDPETKTGDVIGPIEEEGANRFLILKINNKIGEFQANYEDEHIKKWTRRKALTQKIDDLKLDYYDSLMEKYPVTLYPENIKKVLEEVLRQTQTGKTGKASAAHAGGGH